MYNINFNIFTGIHKTGFLHKTHAIGGSNILTGRHFFQDLPVSILDLNKPAGNLRHFGQLINFRGIFLD